MEKIKINNLINFVIYFLLFIFFSFDYLLSINSSKSILVQLTFGIIGLISFVSLIIDKKFISLNKIFHIFTLIFLFYTPYHQYLENTTYWNLGSFSNKEFLYANFIIIVFDLLYVIFYKLFFNKKVSYSKEKIYKPISQLTFDILAIISIISVVFLYSTNNLFSDTSLNSRTASSIQIILLKIWRYLPVCSLLYVMLHRQASKIKFTFGNKMSMIIIIAAGLLIFFPFSGTISRYLLFGTYLAIFSVMFFDSKYHSLVPLMFVIGFAFIFPTFNFFKYHTFSELGELQIARFDYTSNDYDAYYMLMNGIKYTKSSGILYGKNIITAILCIIPRSIWPSKLEASGAIISNYFNGSFNNVSCPLICEFYLAFGIIGLIIGPFIVSLIFKWFDKNTGRKIWNDIFYFMLLGLLFAILRGALLPFSSFLYSISISYIIIRCVVNFCKKLSVEMRHKGVSL